MSIAVLGAWCVGLFARGVDRGYAAGQEVAVNIRRENAGSLSSGQLEDRIGVHRSQRSQTAVTENAVEVVLFPLLGIL